jgi:hypothetical protein
MGRDLSCQDALEVVDLPASVSVSIPKTGYRDPLASASFL